MTIILLNEARNLVLLINEKQKLAYPNSLKNERLNNLYNKAVHRYLRRQRLFNA
jgi:hypothetical protein